MMIAIGEAHWSELVNCKEALTPFRKNKDLRKALLKRMEEEGIDDVDPDIVILVDEKEKNYFAVIGANNEGHGRLILYRFDEYENA
jgi:hypothetical protein